MSETIFSANYDWTLVALSIVLAFCASYTTLELAGRSVSSPLNRYSFWTLAGALSVAVGLWGVQGLGILAFRLPLPHAQNLPAVLVSLLIAIGCSAAACLAVSWQPIPKSCLLGGTVTLSGCISALLYSAVEGARFLARPHNVYFLAATAVVVAGAATFAAFQIGLRWQDAARAERWVKLACSAIAGVAVAGIQCGAMLLVDFHGPAGLAPVGAVITGHTVLVTFTVAFGVFGLLLLLAGADRVFVAQRGLLHSEQERWRLVMSANQDGLFDFNLITGEVFYSPRWKEILGYASDELENTIEAWQERIHPDDKKEVDASVEEYLRGGQGTAEMEYRLRHRDESWRWILARSQAVWDDKGRPIRLVGSHCDISDRKQAAKDLRLSEARFSAFMQHNPCIAFIKDSAGKLVYTNPTFERVWKLQPGEWLGKSNQEIWPAAVAERETQIDEEVLSAKVRSEMIEEFQLPDGETHQFLTTKFSFPEDSGGRALGGVSIDITERMRSEEQLRASEARYRELFEHNPLPSWIYRTRDLRILDVNQAAIDHYGWSRAQFLNLTVRSLLITEDADAIEAELKEGLPKPIRSKPIRHRRNKKSDIFVELSSHQFEANGTILCRIMANDVTDRIAAENVRQLEHGLLETLVAQRTAELQTSEAKWRSLVEALPQIVWSSRPDGYCEYISHQLADYTGVPAADLNGWGWLNFVHPADRETVRARWMATVETGSDYDVEYRIRSKDGAYRWFMTRGRAISTAFSTTGNEPATRWLGTTSDIEDQKRHKEQLETAVAERTLALAEARDRAETAAKAKSEFLASMSHEIRTPMNGVIGMTTLMLDTPLTSEQRCYLDTIRSCGDALLSIINDVLDFSKIEAGKMELESVEFDLQTVLEESIELISASAAAKNIELSLDVADDVPFNAVGDPGRLRQILLNLLSNAVKFTPCGSVALSVSRETSLDSSLILRFGVRDTGIGLTAEEQSALFQPFVQADRATTRRFGGTGLGLSIVKRLVELMSGSVGVSSEPGEGSTFWFRVSLSFGTSLMPSDFRALASGRILLLTGAGRGSGNIRRYLERARLEVIERVWTGNEAEALTGIPEYAHSPVSFIIADAAAFETYSQLALLRSQPQFAHCAILVLGSPADWPEASLSPLPRVDFLSKPVRCLPFLKTVRRLLAAGDSSHDTEQKQRSLSLRGAEVLLVEDNQVNQLIAKLFLAKMGCRVAVASNGIEACQALETHSFDLILMDCQMPEMDGFEATRIIREREAGRHRTPIVALSAGVLKEERDRCYAAGMDDFLSKPLGKQELEAALHNWLTERQPIQRAAAS